MKNIRLLSLLVLLAFGITAMSAQNLTASQMNIYFGSPKKVTVRNSQGTVITEFDRNGFIKSMTQGNMSMVYEWAEGRNEVTLTMFQGQNIKDVSTIKVSELSARQYSYNIGGQTDVKVDFLDNGAMSGYEMSNPLMTTTCKYLYNAPDDMFPYAIEESMGNQSVKISVTIDKIDSVGNPIEFTQNMGGQKDVTRQAIEYY